MGAESTHPRAVPPPTLCIPGHRMLTFSNNVEPANGFLVRYLRRKLVESDGDINANREELLRVLDWVPKLWYHLHTFLEKHSTSDFLIGTACASPGRGWRGSLSLHALSEWSTHWPHAWRGSPSLHALSVWSTHWPHACSLRAAGR